MVYFAIFDPARKIKQLVQLFHRSGRHQDQARSCRKTSILDHVLPKHDIYPYTLAKESAHSLKVVEHDVIDDVYYARGEETRGSETEYCTLKMENTLFKVHKSVLMRDDSVFMDWKFVEGGSLRSKDKNAPIIHLPESAFPFRDLLWALHNLDLEDTHFVYEPSLARLLNVAELSRKYRFSSYEAWAVDRLHAACQGTTLPFSLSTALASSSSITLTEHVHSISTDIDSLCARLLNVAYASRHSPLLLLMMKKLVVQILWHDYHPGAILFDAVEALSRRRSRYQRHIRQLLGVIYYRMLVDMQYATASDKSPILVFPLHMDVEQRMRFLSAHRSLTEMWVNLKYSPLVGPTSHGTCQATWDRRWRAATRHAELSSNGKAGHTDVLGLLKATMIHLRKGVADSNSICLECSLAGLESIDAVRDDIINNLGDLFVYS